MKTTKLLVGLVNLVAILSLTGCASKPSDPEEALKENIQVLRDVITNTVKDEVRRNSLLVSTRSLESTLYAYNQAYSRFATEYGKLNRQYDTPRKELENILVSYRKTRRATLSKVAKIHFDMVAQTTEEEWKKITQI